MPPQIWSGDQTSPAIRHKPTSFSLGPELPSAHTSSTLQGAARDTAPIPDATWCRDPGPLSPGIRSEMWIGGQEGGNSRLGVMLVAQALGAGTWHSGALLAPNQGDPPTEGGREGAATPLPPLPALIRTGPPAGREREGQGALQSPQPGTQPLHVPADPHRALRLGPVASLSYAGGTAPFPERSLCPETRGAMGSSSSTSHCGSLLSSGPDGA